MKAKSIIIFFLSVFLSTVLFAQIQYPVNGDMEDWVKGTVLGMEYDSLVNWDTPNRLGTALSVGDTVTFKEESIVHSGNSAIKLETESALIIGIPLTVPGTVSTGLYVVSIATLEFGVEGGAAIDCRPDAFEGFYQYEPFGADTLFFNIQMYNASGDTIADIDYQDDQASSSYVPFNIPITYTSSDDPVLVQITMTASSSAGGAQDGTLLYIDDVVLTGGDCVTGIFDAFQEPASINVWPNPTAEQLNFNFPGSGQAVLTVTDISGKTVLKSDVQKGSNSLRTENLAEGIYILRIFENQRTTFKSSFEIVH